MTPFPLSQSPARLASHADFFFFASQAGIFVFLQRIHPLSILENFQSTRI